MRKIKERICRHFYSYQIIVYCRKDNKTTRCVIPKMTQKHNNKIPEITFSVFFEFLRYFDAANYFFYHQSISFIIICTCDDIIIISSSFPLIVICFVISCNIVRSLVEKIRISLSTIFINFNQEYNFMNVLK